MNTRLFRAALSILTAVILTFQATASLAQPDTVKTGIYVTSIHNIDFTNREYDITFWLWLKYNDKKFDFLRYLEIPSAKSHTYEFVNVDSSDNKISVLMKVQCVMKDSWRVSRFPFDTQKLWLTIENSQYDAGSLIFAVDTTGAIFDRRIRYSLAGWQIDSCKITSGTSIYETAFGIETAEKPHSVYSAFKMRTSISHVAPGLLFLKMFMGMYVAFLIGYICFYIDHSSFDSRFSLSVGALFAVIGNKYIVESSLPEATTFTLVDSLHGLTLIFIMLTVLATAISLKLTTSNKRLSASRFDIIAAQVLLVVYVCLNIHFIWQAIQG
jgi:hypothetical protein